MPRPWPRFATGASCGTGGTALLSAHDRLLGSSLVSSAHSPSPRMTTRAPIHLGSGEPVLLLHPFLISQLVWQNVAPRLAATGRSEVFAPTVAGHNGGPPP